MLGLYPSSRIISMAKPNKRRMLNVSAVAKTLRTTTSLHRIKGTLIAEYIGISSSSMTDYRSATKPVAIPAQRFLAIVCAIDRAKVNVGAGMLENLLNQSAAYLGFKHRYKIKTITPSAEPVTIDPSTQLRKVLAPLRMPAEAPLRQSSQP